MSYFKQAIKSIALSHVFTILAGLAGIISFAGWALEKFVIWTQMDIVLGIISTIVIIIFSLLPIIALIALTKKQIELDNFREKNINIINNQFLNQRISYQLRKAITALYQLQQEVLLGMKAYSSDETLQIYLQSNERRAAEIFKKFATKSANSAHKQIETYLANQGINEEVRLTVKAIFPNDSKDGFKDWSVRTAVRDHRTWEKLNNNDEDERPVIHKIKDNTDYLSIIESKLPCYACNNLFMEGNKYKNSSPNWKDNYNASFVVPILSYFDNEPVYYGFVAADSLNSSNASIFIDDNNAPLYNMIKNLAESFAVWHLCYDAYIKTVLSEFEFVKNYSEKCRNCTA